jgi:hypothetical protein
MNKNDLIHQINQGLSTWKMAEYFNTSQPNIRYWLKKFDLKTVRKINTINKNRTCLTCNAIKPQENFYKRANKYTSQCIECFKKSKTYNRNKVKQLAVNYLGGSCSVCGYNKCLAALEFHHVDSTTKDKNYSNYKNAFTDKFKTELDKCVLLCANCHREHHSSTTDI